MVCGHSCRRTDLKRVPSNPGSSRSTLVQALDVRGVRALIFHNLQFSAQQQLGWSMIEEKKEKPSNREYARLFYIVPR